MKPVCRLIFLPFHHVLIPPIIFSSTHGRASGPADSSPQRWRCVVCRVCFESKSNRKRRDFKSGCVVIQAGRVLTCLCLLLESMLHISPCCVCIAAGHKRNNTQAAQPVVPLTSLGFKEKARESLGGKRSRRC